ncbi:MAG: baseplate J/gp47 family protein [Lentimicrobium sp.]
MPDNCNQIIDPLKLIRDGVNQEQRLSQALKPEYAPVNERTVAHGMLFARALSAYLKYFDIDNTHNGNWTPFFDRDISIRLAVASIQEIEDYKSQVKASLGFLNNLDNETKAAGLINNLSYLFSYTSTLAKQLDVLKEGLPGEEEQAPAWLTLKTSLKNLITSQLAPAFQRLISYHKAGNALGVILGVAPSVELKIMGEQAASFEVNETSGFSIDWVTDGSADWNTFVAGIIPDSSVYGNPAGSVFELTNHIATHNLFTSVLDQFLKVYACVISDAQTTLEASFTKWDRHDPHYTLFLGFLRLFEHAGNEANTLTGRHLDFYYRDILRLKEKPAVPANVHLTAELAKQSESHQFKTGDQFIAGKDAQGKEVFFANTRDMVANQAKIASLQSLYRHGSELVGSGVNAGIHAGRLYASPIADSADGLGKKIETEDKSWHPFYNKVYRDGALTGIVMPEAEAGFALSSHYLLMAEGDRTITLQFSVSGSPDAQIADCKYDVICLVTTEKGWLEVQVTEFKKLSYSPLQLIAGLSGADPAIRPYLAKTHGYSFDTTLPVMMIKLKHQDDRQYIYSTLETVEIQQITLNVDIKGLKTLAVSNDFGPVDTSKPFQPFGAQPVTGSSFLVGSAEVFQKKLDSATIRAGWLETPSPYTGANPTVNIDFLNAGSWVDSGITAYDIDETEFGLTGNLDKSYKDESNPEPDGQYSTESRQGFVRLKLSDDFGQKEYQTDLLKYLRKEITTEPGGPPSGPLMNSLSLDYVATQVLSLTSSDETVFTQRSAKFYHVQPFGYAEQHTLLSSLNKIFLLPQFDFERDGVFQPCEAEFYIGLTGLKPPQNISLLFQVADGTANPLSLKPSPHLHWSYLLKNEWIAFKDNEVEDSTEGLLKSGIVTLVAPSVASDSNTLLPSGQHWIRMAVSGKTDAVCRLLSVAAQAMLATFTDQGNDPQFSATVLPAGTITKPVIPDGSIKKINQPFDSFGGRATELPSAFYTRVSERLRHKDRAIALWDYEHLVLEAFPEIYRVKCLNHTQYEPTESGDGIYRELAPGNVTIVTVPGKQYHNQRDPLRPYTNLGTLEDIEAFLKSRTSCFVRLHVRNPKFEEVKVNFKLKLFDGYDEAFYTSLLKEAITRFLSPWAFPGGESPTFGGKVYKSVLIDFIEEQVYVDYVTDFEMFHLIDGVGNTDKDEIEGSRAVSILVSVPADKHGITVIHPNAETTTAEKCNCES